MTTKAGVGYSNKTDSKEAGTEATRSAMTSLGNDRCNLVLVFTTSKHNPTAIREGIRAVVGNEARIVGGFAVGIITKENLSYGGYEVGIATLSMSPASFELFCQGGLDKNEKTTGAALGKALSAAGAADLGGLLLMYDSVKDTKPSLNMATPMIEGMNESMGGKWPNMAGVGMLGDMQFQKTSQWFDDRIETQSLMALTVKGGVKMDTVIMHGCKPSGGYHKVTKADGPVVLEIDNRPAVEVVGELLGGSKTWEEYPLFVTLGVNKGDKFGAFREENYANRLCMGVDRERKGLVMFEPDLVAGTEIQLMRRSIDFEYLKERIDGLFSEIKGKPFFAFYIDCAGRASAYCNAEREEAEEVQKWVGSRVPVLGMYSGVEIAKVGKDVQALDWTGVLAYSASRFH